MPLSKNKQNMMLGALIALTLLATWILFSKVYIVRDIENVNADYAAGLCIVNPLSQDKSSVISTKISEREVRHFQINRCADSGLDKWNSHYLELTEEEKLIFATIIRLEAGGCTYECQMGVASVILNRMIAYNQTLREVIFAPKQFTPSPLIDKTTGKSNYPPYDLNWEVVEDICEYGPILPPHILFFRSEYYHEWAQPYDLIDRMYFSYVV